MEILENGYPEADKVALRTLIQKCQELEDEYVRRLQERQEHEKK
jgi:hypothetical protein